MVLRPATADLLRDEWNFGGRKVSRDQRGIYRVGSLAVDEKRKNKRGHSARSHRDTRYPTQRDSPPQNKVTQGSMRHLDTIHCVQCTKILSAEARVEARLAQASTPEGKQALMARLAEYTTTNTSHRPKTNYLKLNRRVLLPDERILHLRNVRSVRNLRKSEVEAARQRLEEQALQALSLHTGDNEKIRKLRSLGTAFTLAQLVHREKNHRDRVWLSSLKAFVFISIGRHIIERRRALVLHLKAVGASALIAKFVSKALRRKALHNATDILKHITAVLGAQTEFRRACRQLVIRLVTVQRYYRQRSLITRARTTVLLRQWHCLTLQLQSTQSEHPLFSISAETRHHLLRDFIRNRRQDYVLKRIVFEQYDLRPVLIEALVAKTSCTEILSEDIKVASRHEARIRVDAARKFGYVSSLSRQLGISLHSFPSIPRLRLLATQEELLALNARAMSPLAPLSLPNK